MPLQTHPDFVAIDLTLHVDGKEPQHIPIDGAESIYVQIPGGVKYRMTLRFKVKNRELSNLKYKQNVKKAGVTVRSREVDLGTREPSETEIYEQDFPEDETPGGWLMRGKYAATSYYSAGDEMLIVNDWTLEITA
ncbi:hypothetical protein KGF56_002656 [Candida oxycetoniae]|uniref:Rho GDP-dissociation inhibitor n=1 Tax=Candida oxycetoniae TaxID=497107 RepID=A0AAI9SWS8_9ASCO|nr:uncharacterized protein KGF56_002656 [Candida oxycetoniae]KAI3404557.1 hypothetical protein KGF56_002656 [Candida oxycetoniae]